MSSKPKSTKYVGEPYETLLVLQKNNFDSKVSKITNIVKKDMENPAKSYKKGQNTRIRQSF